MTIDVIFLNGYKSGEFHCHTHAHQMYEKKFLNCLCAVAVWFPRVPPWKKRLLDMSGSRLSKKNFLYWHACSEINLLVHEFDALSYERSNIHEHEHILQVFWLISIVLWFLSTQKWPQFDENRKYDCDLASFHWAPQPCFDCKQDSFLLESHL